MRSPTFREFFTSYYYSNTYLSSVDLSDECISKDLCLHIHSEVAKKAQELLSNKEVQSVFSEPLSYTNYLNKNDVLKRHGFTLLAVKQEKTQFTPYYSVVEHPHLKDWVIKTGAVKVSKDEFKPGLSNDKNEMTFFSEEESLLRIEMAKRISRIAKDNNLDVVIPEKKFVAYANVEGMSQATKKYFVVCKKIDILSAEDTFQKIFSMSQNEQRELAKKISTLVQKLGFVDSSFNNIRLTPDGRIAIIDTEPAGLMVAKKPGFWNKFFGPCGASVEKCARIGLYTLMRQTATQTANKLVPVVNIEAFHNQIKCDYENACKYKLSKWKIVFSIATLGLIPLINVIVSIAKIIITNRIMRHFDLIDQEALALKTLPTKRDRQTAFEKLKIQEIANFKRFFAYTEGVPYEK
jgi:hypothetical protein